MGEKSPEEQKGILSKSFELWKRMSTTYPKMVLETIKDPKAGVEQLQDEVNQQINQVKDSISSKLDPDTWRPATKSDFQDLTKIITQLSQEVKALNNKMDKLQN